MRISRVRIENFRNFHLLEINPFPRNAVLVGENGIGKSNLLYALRLVLDPDLPDSARRLRAEDICEQAEATLADGATVRVEVDLTDIKGDPAGETAFDGCFVQLDPLTARLTYLYRPQVDPEQSSRPLTRDDYDFEIVGGPAGDRDARRVRRDVSVTVLPALRDAADVLSRWRGSPLQDLLEAYPPEAGALAAAAADITKAMDGLSSDKHIKGVAEGLSGRLENMAGPQLDVTPTLGFASSDPARLLRSIRLYVDPRRSRSVADTSTGNANVIFLGLLLERLAARRATDVVVDTILAVEEPEAHLHPVLQRQLFRYLLRSETALVVTTHSPHIAAVTQLEALVLLRRAPDGATVAATVAGAELTPIQRTDLERYLDVSRAELLFCTAAILVEGPSEVYLLPALARVLEFDLDAYGVIVANVAGTDFAPYRRLLSSDALNVPHVVITDGDPVRNGKQVFAGLARAAKLLPENFAWVPVADTDEAGDDDQVAPDDEPLDRDDVPTDEQPDQELMQRVLNARQDAARQQVFVGERTLEIDVAPLLADQMIAAHAELGTSPKLQAKFEAAVQAVASGDDDTDDRKELLRRVGHVSKGRFAQRLAAHIEADATAMRSIIDQAAVAAGPGGDAPYLDHGVLMNFGSYGYLLAALDDVARQVAGHGLVRRPPSSNADGPKT